MAFKKLPKYQGGTLQEEIERTGFHREVLDSRAVVMGEFRPIRQICMGIRIPKGSAHDSPKKQGLHHLTEHMLFKPQTRGDMTILTERIEDFGGVVSAATTPTYTEGLIQVPLDRYKRGLQYLTLLMGRIPKVSRADFEHERDVIKIEIGKYHDNPESFIIDLLHEESFELPFGNSIVGDIDSVSRITRRDVHNIWEASYLPSTFIVSSIGGIPPEQIARDLEKILRKQTKTHPITDIPVIVPKRKFSHRNIPRRGLMDAHLGFSFIGTPVEHEDAFAWDVIDAFLCEGFSSCLYRSIRETSGLIYHLQSAPYQVQRMGVYELSLQTDPNKIHLVEKLIKRGFEAAKNMSQSEFRKAKQKALGRYDSRERTLDERREEFAEEEQQRGNAELLYNNRRNIAKVRLEQVRRVIQVPNFSTGERNFSSVYILPA
ncbi:MAG: pitrilysin family protein [Nanoarchaeota archaeon]